MITARKILDRIFGPSKRYRQLHLENESLREKIKSMEKKERDMQTLNVNLRHEADISLVKIKNENAKTLLAFERNLNGLRLQELRAKQDLEEKKLINAQQLKQLNDAQKELKELRRLLARFEAGSVKEVANVEQESADPR
ncbi:MAG: hypothetical protein LBJ23_00760 [Tannerella sp.]|jgi:hypothetical protein|nr:hypothetical protein [Tannerella sp.]